MAATYNPSEKRIITAYEKGISAIHDFLLEQLSIDNVDLQEVIDQTAILEQLSDELLRMDNTAQSAVVEAMTERFKAASKKFYDDIGMETDISFNRISNAKLQIIIADMQHDLLAATSNTEDSLKQIVRDIFEKRIQLSSLQGQGWEQIAKQLTEELSEAGLSKLITEEGFVGIVDAAGKRWNLRTYAEMVMQTKLMDADIEAGRVEGLQTGVDLAAISSHGASDDCAKWEGCIVSMNGMTEGFPTYDEVKATNECFHPKCQHHLQPVRSLDLVHPTILKKNEQKMKENWQTLSKTE